MTTDEKLFIIYRWTHRFKTSFDGGTRTWAAMILHMSASPSHRHTPAFNSYDEVIDDSYDSVGRFVRYVVNHIEKET